MKTTGIPVLFVHNRSNYKKDKDFDCYDEKRNAYTFNSSQALICHPPCRLYSRLKGLSNAPIEEKQAAYFSLDLVRKNGGILEHPHDSDFWKENKIIAPNTGYDEFGGFTILILQSWFNYYTPKKTILYIVGINKNQLPKINEINNIRLRHFENLTKKQRSETTQELVTYLKQIINIINLNKMKKQPLHKSSNNIYKTIYSNIKKEKKQVKQITNQLKLEL